MATILEMAAEIVAAHASTTNMSKEELIAEISCVYQALSALEKGEAVTTETPSAAAAPAISKKKAFGKDKIICMICGKGMKTLTRHLKTAHDLKPGQYRKQFGIPRTQSLAASNYSESRRRMAIDRGLGEKLAKARAARAKSKAAAPVKPAKAAPKTKKK
jgi:predicted transcriptional regulator